VHEHTWSIPFLIQIIQVPSSRLCRMKLSLP
jgi:hypothetical protein